MAGELVERARHYELWLYKTTDYYRWLFHRITDAISQFTAYRGYFVVVNGQHRSGYYHLQFTRTFPGGIQLHSQYRFPEESDLIQEIQKVFSLIYVLGEAQLGTL